ncbi:MAG: YggT family protein [Actinomycetota bacterium]|nr:YggT family protein [Actinomycetota bacterium]
MSLLLLLIDWFVLAMFVWIVLSYIVNFGRVGWDHPVRRIYDGLSKLVEPVLRPIRSVVPPLRIGGTALDLSPLLLIMGLQLLSWLLGGR